VLRHEGVGILPVRHRHDLHRGAFGEQRVSGAKGGAEPGLVAVV
jgi:hypothetical protein